MRKAFDVSDKNKDGRLEASEVPGAVEAFEKMGGPPSLAQTAALTHGEEAEAKDATVDESGGLEILQDLDTNKDGFLSLAEIMPMDDSETTEDEKKMMRRAFDVSDKNRDGKLEASEVPGAMKEFERMGPPKEI